MNYVVNGVKYDGFSSKNQRILDMLVNREIHCCMTQEIEYMLKRVQYGDQENPFYEEHWLKICDAYNKDEREIMEWWAVTPWFGEKLQEQGCVVIESYGKSYWGRKTSGQSISLDSCIELIAEDMHILDGMEYDWGKTFAM